MQYLKADTETKVVIGPVVAVGDGFTPVTTLSLSTADEAEMLKHDASAVTDISGNTFAAITGADGYYNLTLTAAQLDTEGRLTILINDDSLCLPVRHDFIVQNANVFDSLHAAAGTDYLQTSGDDAATIYTYFTTGTNEDAFKADVSALATATSIAALNDLSSADVTAAVPTVGQVADAVWDEALYGHNVGGSAGKAIRQVKEATVTVESSVNDLSATTTSFVTDLTEATDDFYNDKVLVFNSGTLSGQARVISDYNGTTKAITLDEALTSAPSDADSFIIIATHEHSISEIQAGLATAASIAALNDLSSADVTAAVPTAAQIRTEIDSNSTQLALLVDGQGYQLTILAGAISNAGTATEAFTFTYNSTDYAATYAGLDTSGNRGTTVLSKP